MSSGLYLFCFFHRHLVHSPGSGALLGSLLDHILFNPNLWVKTPPKVCYKNCFKCVCVHLSRRITFCWILISGSKRHLRFAIITASNLSRRNTSHCKTSVARYERFRVCICIFCCLSFVIVRVKVVFRKTVGDDWRFDYLSGSHLQSQDEVTWVWSWLPLR